MEDEFVRRAQRIAERDRADVQHREPYPLVLLRRLVAGTAAARRRPAEEGAADAASEKVAPRPKAKRRASAKAAAPEAARAPEKAAKAPAKSDKAPAKGSAKAPAKSAGKARRAKGGGGGSSGGSSGGGGRKTGRRSAAAAPARGPIRRLFGWCFRMGLRASAVVVGVVLLWVAAYAAIDPPGGLYMAQEYNRRGALTHEPVSMDAISPNLARAVVAAEDARFCSHNGLDGEAIREALEDYAAKGRLRGASTITQQAAKNIFLWHGRTLWRKAMEVPFAALMELMWSKRRILENYLNIAEFGDGIFGAEAAARHYYGVPARELSLTQSARLATLLPNPKARDPNRLGSRLRKRARAIAAGARTIEARGDDACFLRS